MTEIRRPSVAGLFYPEDSEALSSVVAELLGAVPERAQVAKPKALIAPHAGYVYSGPVAATAFQQLLALRGRVSRVVLLGPSHFVAFRGVARSGASAFSTPLGVVPVDAEAESRLTRKGLVVTLEQAHGREHSLEVELPFLQETLGEFRLVPLVVGEASAGEVGAVLEDLWGGEETLVVVSSDLSHYHEYRAAIRLDAETCRAIEGMSRIDLTPAEACGCCAINGLVWVARRRRLEVTTLDLRNSGDTAGARDEVVGYGSWAFTNARS